MSNSKRMTRPPIPTRELAGLVSLIILFLAPAVAYWISSRTNIAECLWGTATCSITFATYLLALITAATLIAAIWAGGWAFKTWQVGDEALAIERSTILGQRRCRNTSHREESDFVLNIEKDCLIRDGAPRAPSGYDPIDYELISLGRSPIVNAVVYVYCVFKQSESNRHRVEVGSLRSDASAHCTLWIHDGVLSDVKEICWTSDSAECEGSLVFKPLPPHQPDVLRKRPYHPGATPKSAGRSAYVATVNAPKAPEGAKMPTDGT